MSHLLFKAVEKGDLQKVIDLLDQGADIAWTHKGTGRTALSQAAIDGSLPIACLLIERGADINWRDSAIGYTPLGWACAQGHTDLVRLFLQQNADTDINLSSSGYSFTPLMNAASAGHAEIVDILLKAGADVHAVTTDGRNALSMAEKGKQQCVDMLKQAGAQLPAPLVEPVTIAWPDVGEHEELVDYSRPESVLRAFMLAMNRSESQAWQRKEKDGVELLSFDIVKTEQQEIFGKFCTPKERAYGRLGSFGWPFDYEPEETLHDISLVSVSRAELLTRQAKNRALCYENKYVLLKKKGRWLVDSKKNRVVGLEKWESTIL